MTRSDRWLLIAVMWWLVVPMGAGAAAAEELNAMCPVTMDQAVDPEKTLTYQGREVGFCCERCRRKFERDPEAYVGNLPAGYFAAASLQAPAADVTVRAAEPATDHAHGSESEGHEHADGEHEAEGAGGEASGHDHAEAGHGEVGHVRDGGSVAEGDGDHDEADGDHDHASHEHGGVVRGPVMHLIGWLGKFHPPSVNFPIALMLAALVAEALFAATQRPLFDAAGRFTVWFAVIGTLGAVTLGWFFGGFRLTDDDWIMTTHRWVGTAAGAWMPVLAWAAVRRWPRGEAATPGQRAFYVFALVVGVMLVNINGFFGGALVYGINHYAW